MWTKNVPSPAQPQTQTHTEAPPALSIPGIQKPASDTTAFYNPPARPSTASSSVRTPACVGATLEIKGKISGEEDLQIDGKVEGPVSVPGHRVTVGRSGQVQAEITAREVMIYGKVTGNIRASDRVEIKKDGMLTGDITTARISIEDGAIFKGRIEIERQGQERKFSSQLERQEVLAPA